MNSTGSVPGWTAMTRFAPLLASFSSHNAAHCMHPPTGPCHPYATLTNIPPTPALAKWSAMHSHCADCQPIVKRLQNKHIHPLPKSSIGMTAGSLGEIYVSFFPFQFQVFLCLSLFSSFLFALDRCEPLEINPWHWSARHIGISFTSFTCFETSAAIVGHIGWLPRMCRDPGKVRPSGERSFALGWHWSALNWTWLQHSTRLLN